MQSYDIIIVGAGAAGLLLADAMGRDPFFENHTVLLLEKEPEKGNERTWCFWETGEGPFDSLLFARWEQLYFAGQDYQANFPIAPYSYKMLKGSRFHEAYRSRLATYPNIQLLARTVTGIQEEGNRVKLTTEQGAYTARQVFNSVFSWEELRRQSSYPVLEQHFVGWFVRAENPVFDAGKATFMDFSVAQLGNTRFMYVLPFTEREALVEYTLFSSTLLEMGEYEQAIAQYLKETLGCGTYEILDREQGRIPMTCFNFRERNSKHLLHIGTAGGWAKPSTGYTFKNTQRKVVALTAHLKAGKTLQSFGRRNRYWWYDLLLLDILDRNNERGRYIFEALFKRRKATLILKFLDEQTTVWEDLRIIWACPKADFIKALFRRLSNGKLFS